MGDDTEENLATAEQCLGEAQTLEPDSPDVLNYLTLLYEIDPIIWTVAQAADEARIRIG
jgi:hypothetical protein